MKFKLHSPWQKFPASVFSFICCAEIDGCLSLRSCSIWRICTRVQSVGRDLSSLLCSLVHTLPIERLLCRRWGGGILGGEQPGYKIIIISVEEEEEEEECVHRPQEEKDPLVCWSIQVLTDGWSLDGRNCNYPQSASSFWTKLGWVNLQLLLIPFLLIAVDPPWTQW